MPTYFGMSIDQIAIRLGAAMLIGTAIGVERELRSRPAGTRTHVLVSIGACMVALMENCLVYEAAIGHINFNFGRITAQVVSGIGFLGAGTILTAKHKVTGLTTAASLWNVACLGLACGYGFYAVAAAGGTAVIGVLVLMQRIVRASIIKKVEIRFTAHDETTKAVEQIYKDWRVMVLDTDYLVKKVDGVRQHTYIYELLLPANVKYAALVRSLSEVDHIQSVKTTDA